MKSLILFIVFISIIYMCGNNYGSTEGNCQTIGSVTSNSIPTSGTLKVFVVFVQFKDDNYASDGWPLNSYPSWANDFVSSNGSGPFAYNNLSEYFYEMSNHNFKVEGDVYDNLVTTSKNESEYTNMGEVNHEVLTQIEPHVQFAQYDNLNGNSWGTDGEVDFIYIIYRKSNTLMSYTGIAQLNLSSTIYTHDGVRIVGADDYITIHGGVQQRSGYAGRDYTVYISAHELGHYLFGSGHIWGIADLGLMNGGPAYNSDRGMISWERQRLGWLSYQDRTSDGSFTCTDYMQNRDVKRIPISTDEYFLIENRQKISPHDWAGAYGIYFLHVTNANSYPPNIEVKCADGDWDFNINSSTQTLTKSSPNPVSGYNELNFYQTVSGTNYYCVPPFYPSYAAWGNDNDAFNLTYNNVFSPYSNPRSTNNQGTNFTLEVTNKDQNNNYALYLYKSNPNAGSPSKPQNLRIYTNLNGHPNLEWNANQEPDIYRYHIYRNGIEIAAISGTYYTDYGVCIYAPVNQYDYMVKAEDNTSLYSVQSDVESVKGFLTKRAIVVDSTISNSFTEKNLNKNTYDFAIQNYPNPFNPETNISYTIPENAIVTLRVYDVLGNQIVELVNDFREKGTYNIRFDGSKLSSGIYFCNLTSNKNNSVKKMLLIK
jgi:hypothetical protein